jgi:ABC-type transport system involved in cytochrome c biogenesis permease component
MHGIFALLTFTSGGIGAILSAKVQSGPSRYLSILLGAITLAVLAFAMLGSNTQAFEEMGDGGVERWVAYPVTMWLVVFGAYLMGRHQPQDAATAATIPL